MKEKIVKYYEDITETPIKIDVDEKKFFSYASKTSLHSFVTEWAYGKVLERRCVDISNGETITGVADVDDASKRYCIKIIACMPDWRKYVNSLKLTINGKVVWDSDETFFEQVNLGWPSQYIAIPDGVICQGKNTITACCENISGGGLYLSELKLISFPKFEKLCQVSVLNYVKTGGQFAVAIFDKEHAFTVVKDIENCKFIEAKYYNDICVLVFNAGAEGKMHATADFLSATVELYMPTAVENKDEFLFGTDGDDHRHDDSWENRFIIESGVMSGMGNFIQFRPRPLRNYYKIMSDEEYEKLFELMSAFGIRYGLCGNGKDLENLVQNHQDNFVGYHIHEPYWFFCAAQLYPELCQKKYGDYGVKLMKIKNFEEGKQIYTEMLKSMREKYSRNIGVSSSGSPSFLCVYEDVAGFERITIEPVSNINMLTGAVRTINVKMWGAHVPTDWYFGVPVNKVKSNKHRLALQYLYLNGASYIYAENSLYKTNAFERCDFESDFCKTNRMYHREFYDYVISHPRKGKLLVDNAFIYGRNEFIMWKINERMAELNERDWDSNVWGKWNNDYHVCWNATEAWLPASKYQNAYESPLNKKLFSGTPYGNVDIVYAENDFSNYKTLSLLGWNTMDDKLLERLMTFVYSGGRLVMSYSQFNFTDNPIDKKKFPKSEKLKDFLGINIKGETTMGKVVTFTDGDSFEFCDSMEIVTGDTITAETLCADINGQGVVYKNSYGQGEIYFTAFEELIKNGNDIAIIEKLLHIVGEQGDSKCNNNNVSFTIREDEKKYYIDVLNMNCIEGKTEKFKLEYKGYIIQDKINVGEIKHYEFYKN